MKPDTIVKIGVLAFIVMLMVTGSFRLAEDGRDGTALWAAAMILLGVLITVELHDRFGGGDHRDGGDDDGE